MFFGQAGHVTDWHWDFQENFTVTMLIDHAKRPTSALAWG